MYNDSIMFIRNIIKGTMHTYIQYMYTMAPQDAWLFIIYGIIYSLNNLLSV